MPIRFVSLTFSLLFLTINTLAQTQPNAVVYWASNVLGVSSESIRPDQSPEYRAIQALGKPNRMPQHGPSYCAWQPAMPDAGEEWIRVGFETVVPILQVAIAENAGAGSIVRVFLYDEKGQEYLIADTSYAPRGEGQMFRILFKNPTPYRVASLKILLNTARRPGFSQIDAIGISPYDTLIDAQVNVSPKAPKPEQVVKENLGAGVNSKAKELNPVISPDGKTLYFTRWGHPDNLGKIVTETTSSGKTTQMKTQDIWVSDFQNGSWQPARNLGAPLNNDEHNAICSVSADAKTILLLNEYLPNGQMAEGLSQSMRLKTGWAFPTPVRIKNFNQRSRFSEYAISPDRRVMVMAVQRKGTFGNKDLYVAFPQPDDSWSEPKSLGKVVNTAEDETSPFLAADGKTLYFSTGGHAGYGSNDIFMTRRLDDGWTNWSEPENLGPGINTPLWDGYFSIPASGDYAYLSSETNSLGKEDLFRLRLFDAVKPEPVAIVSGAVLNFADKKPLSADVVTEVLSGGTDSLRNQPGPLTYDPQTGDYKLVLALKRSYGLAPVKKGYVAMSETIDLTNERRYREIRKNLYLIPLEPGQKITLNNVFFDQSQFELLPASFSELNRLVGIMKQNPTLEIMLEGHTDNQGDFNLNLKLSEDRVKAVKKYLEDKAIESRRIQTKGWGPTQPVASNLTDDLRRKNRRVDFLVVKK
ncbi:MAG: OmpA family protein [Cytophagaceae bacterium]|nr:OmpA family protein [Cytophagaceae bacterium]